MYVYMYVYSLKSLIRVVELRQNLVHIPENTVTNAVGGEEPLAGGKSFKCKIVLKSFARSGPWRQFLIVRVIQATTGIQLVIL